MKVTREEAAASRERILESASRLFRERGLEGIGVADLMRDAGLTHGGFYGHFASKEDLKAAACERSLERSVEKWTRFIETEKDPVAAIAKRYLSTEHRDDPGHGCAIAALGGDVGREGPAVRRAYTKGLRALLDLLARVSRGATAAARRRRAIATYASLVGALILARAVDDPRLSREILGAVGADY
ncbi:MAG: TetR/AcrR family transcriptional regulator [Usitatibacter sp.]